MRAHQIVAVTSVVASLALACGGHEARPLPDPVAGPEPATKPALPPAQTPTTAPTPTNEPETTPRPTRPPGTYPLFLITARPPASCATTAVSVAIDGVIATWDPGTGPAPLGISTSGPGGVELDLAAGPHTITLVADDGAIVAGAGPYEIDPHMLNYLAFFGDDGWSHHLFMFDDPRQVPAGQAHVRMVNLVRTGETVGISRCQGGPDSWIDPSACTLESQAIGYGETWAASLPIDVPELHAGGSGYLCISPVAPRPPAYLSRLFPSSFIPPGGPVMYFYVVLTVEDDVIGTSLIF